VLTYTYLKLIKTLNLLHSGLIHLYNLGVDQVTTEAQGILVVGGVFPVNVMEI